MSENNPETEQEEQSAKINTLVGCICNHDRRGGVCSWLSSDGEGDTNNILANFEFNAPKNLEELVSELAFVTETLSCHCTVSTDLNKMDVINLILDEYLYKIMEFEKDVDNGDIGANLTPEEDMDRRVKEIPNFIAWLRKYGCDTKKLDIRPSEDRTSLEFWICKPVEKDENLFQIRKDIVLSSIDENETIKAAYKEFEANLSPNNKMVPTRKHGILMTMNILAKRYLKHFEPIPGNRNKWDPYFNILPMEHENILYYSPDELKLLKYCTTEMDDAISLFLDSVLTYAKFKQMALEKPPKFGLEGITYKRFRWAISTCMNGKVRRSRIVNNTTIQEFILFPGIDLLPLETPGDILPKYFQRCSYFLMKAKRAYKENHQLKRCYDPVTTRVFLWHGIPPIEPAYVTYNLHLGMSSKGPHWEKRKRIIDYMDMEPSELFRLNMNSFDFYDNNLQKLFVYVRIHLADQDLLELIHRDETDLRFLAIPTRKVWQFLTTRLRILEQATDLKYRQLNVKLEQKQKTRREETILQLLSSEKSVIHTLLISAKTMLRRAKKTEKKLKKQQRK